MIKVATTLLVAILALVASASAQSQPATPSTAQREPALVSAKDKSDADIFLSGALTSASNADTVYAWDVKWTYPKGERSLDEGLNNTFVFSPRIEFTANKGTNANPDRIFAGGETELVFTTANWAGGNVSWISWFNTAGAEFDRDRVTKAFTYQSYGRFNFRTFAPSVTGSDGKPCTQCTSSSVAFVPRIEAGIELGKNFENKLSSDGSGAVTRLYAGATGYYEFGVKWARFSYSYQVRKPLRDEVFVMKPKSGDAVLLLDSKARQYLELSPIIQVGNWFALKPTFKRGSLPPAFNYIDNEFSLSIQFAAKTNPAR